MKMLLAIVNYDDSRNVMSHLMKAGFSITKLASTGGFLRSGNVTILIGLEDHQVDDAFEIGFQIFAGGDSEFYAGTGQFGRYHFYGDAR